MKTISWLLVGICLAFALPSFSADQSSPIGVVKLYIDACKTGDIAVLKSIIAGPFLERRKILLEKNRGYSDFLKEFYKDIGIGIVAVKPGANENSATVVVKQKPLNGNGGSNIELIVRREPGGPWLIFDEKFAE